MDWLRSHKRLAVVLAIVLIVVIAAVAGGTSDDTTSNTSGSTDTSSSSQNSSNSEKTYRFAERADKQKEDIEIVNGESATVEGVKMTVNSVDYKTRLNDYDESDEGKTYIVVAVKLENTSNETQDYNQFNFRVQTASGQVLDGAFATVSNPLSSGDLVAGGTVSGNLVFEVPVEEGHQYMIWKPDAFDAARAIVELK